MLVWSYVQNVPGKIGKATPAGYTHKKVAQRKTKDQVEWLDLWPSLVLFWCEASRTMWDCCWLSGILSARTAARCPSEEKQVWKWTNDAFCLVLDLTWCQQWYNGALYCCYRKPVLSSHICMTWFEINGTNYHAESWFMSHSKLVLLSKQNKRLFVIVQYFIF